MVYGSGNHICVIDYLLRVFEVDGSLGVEIIIVFILEDLFAFADNVKEGFASMFGESEYYYYKVSNQNVMIVGQTITE